MNIPKVVLECGFDVWVHNFAGETESGRLLIDKYRTLLVNTSVNCRLVNGFIREASVLLYDGDVKSIVSNCKEYIDAHKVSWYLACTVEHLEEGPRFNVLERSAVKQVRELLVNDEATVVQYVKSGVLKNVSFIEGFRNVAKMVLSQVDPIAYTDQFTSTNPCCCVESKGGYHYFFVEGTLYKMGSTIEQGQWNEVSESFKVITALLNSPYCTVNEDVITVSYMGREFIINEAHEVSVVNDGIKKYTVESFREHNRILVQAANPRKAHEVNQMLESIAKLSEMYDSVVSMDNVRVFECQKGKFIVLENGSNLLAHSLTGRQWFIQENAAKVCSHILEHTGINLQSTYDKAVTESIDKANKSEARKIQEQLHNDEIGSIKARIEKLTEQYKNDPAKLMVLANIAAKL